MTLQLGMRECPWLDIRGPKTPWLSHTKYLHVWTCRGLWLSHTCTEWHSPPISKSPSPTFPTPFRPPCCFSHYPINILSPLRSGWTGSLLQTSASQCLLLGKPKHMWFSNSFKQGKLNSAHPKVKAHLFGSWKCNWSTEWDSCRNRPRKLGAGWLGNKRGLVTERSVFYTLFVWFLITPVTGSSFCQWTSVSSGSTDQGSQGSAGSEVQSLPSRASETNRGAIIM